MLGHSVVACLVFLFVCLRKHIPLRPPNRNDLPNCSAEWSHHFAFPPALYERYSFSAFTPPFGVVTVFNFNHANRCGV